MFKSSKINMVLALIIAILLWAYVVTVVNPSQTKNITGIPVSFENADTLTANQLAIRVPEQAVIEIKVEGDRDTISSVKKSDFTATADVSECKSGDNVIAVEISTKKDIKIISKSTVNVHIQVEKIITEQKKIHINSQVKKKNLETVYEIVSGDQVEVTGPESLVGTVNHVKAVVKSDKGYELAYGTLTPVDGNGNEVEGVTLAMETVELKVTRYLSKKVKLKVDTEGTPEEGYRVDNIAVPSKVTIRGEKHLVDEIESLEAEPMDVSDLSQNTTVRLQIPVPEGIEILTDESVLHAEISVVEKNKSQ